MTKLCNCLITDLQETFQTNTKLCDIAFVKLRASVCSIHHAVNSHRYVSIVDKIVLQARTHNLRISPYLSYKYGALTDCATGAAIHCEIILINQSSLIQIFNYSAKTRKFVWQEHQLFQKMREYAVSLFGIKKGVGLSQRLRNGRMFCGGAHLCMNLLILIVLNYPTPGSDPYFELIFLGINSFPATSSSIIALLLR